MEPIQRYDESRNGPLMVTKKGWFFPVYTLTDGINDYGIMNYQDRRYKVIDIQTATRQLSVAKKKWYASDYFVTDKLSGAEIAVINAGPWRKKYCMAFSDGFTLYFGHKNIFSRTWIWQNEQYGSLMSVEYHHFNAKKPFDIALGCNRPENFNELVLTAFAGIQLLLIRQRRSAG